MKKAIGGGILIFGGLFMLAGFFASTRPSTFATDFVLILLFVLAPIVTGGMLIRSNYLSNKKKEMELRRSTFASREKEILKLAKKKDGELTIPEIVAETSMNAEEVDEIMREFVVKQYVDMKITNEGTVVYEFFEFTRNGNNGSKRPRELWSDDREIQ
jgi:hypothetical protein